MKRTNNEGKPAAEFVEERPLTKRNSHQQVSGRTQSRATTTSRLAAVRQAARADKALQFTNLMAHLSVDLLRRSFHTLKRNAAVGSDGISWHAYDADLEQRLLALQERLHQGRYRPTPVRRVMIPKPDGSERALGILCIEDKIVQQAVGEILSQIYEVDFVGFSYGFRPGRGQHDALDALYVGILRRKVNWVLDLDIRQFFDTVDHDWMLRFVKHRIKDPRILRLIRQWLEVGHWDERGGRVRARQGTPQGAIISPLLANIYLHYVYDLWINQWRRRQARGDVVVVRYADDSVLGFQHHWEATRFLQTLSQRMGRFGLSLHPDKTRLIRFGRFAIRDAQAAGLSKPESFDFLGFTHSCGINRIGRFCIRRRTKRKRRIVQLKGIRQALRRRLHRPVSETGAWLHRVVQGHINYYGVPMNSRAVAEFCYRVRRSWYWSLCRRSQRKRLNWQRFARIANYWLPPAKVVHPYPQQRFDAKYSR